MSATRLLLADHLAFENVERPWLWILLAVLGAAVLVATYRGIFQRSERRLTWLLMALRGAGLLALFLALARPSWTSESDVVDAGRVAVVVDNSLSMSLADASKKPRYALAKEAVAKLKKGLEARPGRLEVDLFDINGGPLEEGLPDKPLVEQTDIARAVRETTARLRSRPLAGLVLISDGMDTTRQRHDFREQDFPELANHNVPVFAVGFRADPDASSLDLAVRKPRAPERVMVNNEIKIDVPVTKTNGKETGATVTVKRGREQVASEKVAFGAGNDEKLVSLRLTPREPGHFVYTVAVEADAGVGEKVLANNATHFPLRVEKEKIQVYYVEGFLRYEYKFLKKHLEDDPDVNLTTEVRLVNPDEAAAPAAKITPERLKDKHVVILGDMEAGYLNNAEYQALRAWLEEKGHHALLLLGGYRSFGPEGFHSTPLAEVLPVVFGKAEPYQSEEPFRLELTPEGRRHPVFEVAGDRVKGEADWGKAPPLLGCGLVQRAKAAAEVLAVNPNPNVVRDGQKAPVIVTMPYGEGRTMVVAADTTWRWSRLTRIQGQADTLYARFWSQAIRWLSGRSLDDQRPLLTVNTDRPDYEVGKPVKVTARRQPRPDTPLTTAAVGVEVVSPAGKSVAVEVRANSADPDTFTGTFYPPAGGLYEVAANLKDGGNVLANQASEFLVHGSDLELADTGTNPRLLESIARETGGAYFDIEEADKVADLIPRKERHLKSVRRADFWINPALSLFFLFAVSAEWFIRRRNHLV
jgi:uncharacterized membrane protein